MSSRQQGASGLFVAIILVLVAVGALAVLAISRSTSQNDRGMQAAVRMKAIQAALQGFVAANGRLPCPARPTLGTGDADPDSATADCNFTQGTVPWHTLGLKPEDAIDPWTNKISYRVYTGAAGSLAQAEGASLVQCDTVEPSPAGVSPVAGSAGGLCRPTQNTTEAQFLVGKGFTVTQFGAAVNGVAYVLISHGPSGRGAYTSAGVQQVLPAGTDESTNLAAAPVGGFVAKAHSDPAVVVTDNTFFDDTIAFAQLDDLIRKSGRMARDWPEPFGSMRFNAPSLTPVLGGTAPAPGSLGTNTLAYPTGTVTTFNGSGAQDISFTSAGDQGIGIGSGLSQEASSLDGEYVKIKFNAASGWFAMSLLNFAKTTVTLPAPFDFVTLAVYVEQVELTFYKAGVAIGSMPPNGVVTKDACRNVILDYFIDGSSGTNASYSINVSSLFGSDFDEVQIKPIPGTLAGLNLGLIPSQFYLSEVKNCAVTDTSCLTSLAILNPTTVCP